VPCGPAAKLEISMPPVRAATCKSSIHLPVRRLVAGSARRTARCPPRTRKSCAGSEAWPSISARILHFCWDEIEKNRSQGVFIWRARTASKSQGYRGGARSVRSTGNSSAWAAIRTLKSPARPRPHPEDRMILGTLLLALESHLRPKVCFAWRSW